MNIPDCIKLAYIAGKIEMNYDRFRAKLHGYTVNGKVQSFTEAETSKVKAVMSEIGKKLIELSK